MNTQNESTSPAGRFLAKLHAISQDRGKMAALRRGASDATKRQAWPVLHVLGVDVGNFTALTVGALFAEHPEAESKSWSLGETFRRIATDNDKVREIPESFDKRFRRLLACDSVEDTAEQFKTWVRFAKAKGIRVNYEQMFWDLDGWERRSDAIKLQWARGFWPVRKEASDETVTEEAAP
jgi:CRISPR type I-E-associated protein CasB/Cse2